jgi:predicted GNAT family N-acyltransferase
MTPEILETHWTKHASELAEIRRRVFVEEQGVPIALELDALDQAARHLLAFADRVRPVGTVRLLDDGHIGRMAVLPAWRGQGIGTSLLRHAIQMAKADGQRAFLHAQCRAITFYRRLGFHAEGPVFLDAGIAHRLMRLPDTVSSG